MDDRYCGIFKIQRLTLQITHSNEYKLNISTLTYVIPDIYTLFWVSRFYLFHHFKWFCFRLLLRLLFLGNATGTYVLDLWFCETEISCRVCVIHLCEWNCHTSRTKDHLRHSNRIYCWELYLFLVPTFFVSREDALCNVGSCPPRLTTKSMLPLHKIYFLKLLAWVLFRPPFYTST